VNPYFITLSAGNSFTSLAAVRNGRVVEVIARPSGASIESALSALLSGAGPRPRFAVALSVQPFAWEHIEAALGRRGVRLFQVGRDVPPGIRVRYDPPSAVGMDRLVCARAAAADYGPCVVVDAGTAVTVDVVGEGPVFLGGAIAPGAGLMGRALGDRCALLPGDVEPGAPGELPPRSTKNCMRAGITLGFAGLVDRLVREFRPLAGRDDAPCVATGGEAPLWREFSRETSIHEPQLVHRGLCLVGMDLAR